MSLARTSPSLRSRIIASQAKQFTVPAGSPGVRPQPVESYADRYRGTEFDSHVSSSGPAPEPMVSTGRLFVIVSGSAAISVVAVGLLAALG